MWSDNSFMDKHTISHLKATFPGEYSALLMAIFPRLIRIYPIFIVLPSSASLQAALKQNRSLEFLPHTATALVLARNEQGGEGRREGEKGGWSLLAETTVRVCNFAEFTLESCTCSLSHKTT